MRNFMLIMASVSSMVILTVVYCYGNSDRNFDSVIGIENLVIGLYDISKKEIYYYSRNLDYVENGSCRLGGDVRPCMYHAISFEFYMEMDMAVLDCNLSSSETFTEIGADGESIFNVDFSLTLKGLSGKLTEYGVFIKEEFDSGVTDYNVSCKHDNTIVFSESFSVDYH